VVIKAVITQNIDDLHKDIPKDQLVELHGNYRKNRCEGCSVLLYTNETCKCNSSTKPSIVNFDTSLSIVDLEKAKSILQKTDLLIIMGTSLVVSPVNTLPSIVYGKKDNIVIVNNETTQLDEYARLIYRNDIEKILEEMYNIFKGGKPTVVPHIIKDFFGYINMVDVWVCKECTFENRFMSNSCELCSITREKKEID